MLRCNFSNVFLIALAVACFSLTGHARADSPRVKVIVGNLLPDEGGSKDAAPSPLKSPFGIDFEPSGSLIIVELEGGRVHRASSDGAFATIAGNGQMGYAGDGQAPIHAVFNGMHNVAVTRRGDIYIADTWNHCVRKIAADSSTIHTIAGTGKAGFSGDGGPAEKATFDYMMCVSLDAAEEHLYLADINNRRIRVLDLSTGIVDTIAGNGQEGVPPDGSVAKDSPLVDPRAVAVDSENRVYVLERTGNALRMVTPDGIISTVAGTGREGNRDGKGDDAELKSPKHLCIDGDDNVLIADEGNDLIRKYNSHDGTLTTVLGNKRGTPPISLLHPHGVCIEGGVLYVVDTGHDRILRVEQ
jgi:sugar lactone lactonase YvrE